MRNESNLGGRSLTSPEKDSEPRVGRVKPEATRKSVVLPEPLRPAKATHSPGAIAKFRLRKACTEP